MIMHLLFRIHYTCCFIWTKLPQTLNLINKQEKHNKNTLVH